MRIAFALRSDAIAKPGGDCDKVAKLVAGLRNRGHEAQVVLTGGELNDLKPDIVHLLNLDLPIENLGYAKRCQARSVPYVVSTIFHPPDALATFIRHGDDWFNSVVLRSGGSTETALAAREVLKLVGRRDLRAAGVGFRLRDLQFRLLEGAAHVFAATPGEIRELKRTFPDFSGSVTAVPNGLTFFPSLAPGSETHRSGIVVVGRVEPRKNQNALLRALGTLRRPPSVRFVGGLNRRHPRYVQKFEKLLAGSPSASWIDHLPQADLVRLYSSARMHASASWCEIVSQADMEAFSLGCGLLPTSGSYIGDHIVGLPHLVDPLRAHEDAEGFGAQIEECYALGASEGARLAPEALLTWDDVVDGLLAGYSQALSQ